MRKRHINEFCRTSLGSNRAAGMGIVEDRYDEESGLPKHGPRYSVFNTRSPRPEQSPVITYKLSEEELARYRAL
jgi:hypothetical protein